MTVQEAKEWAWPKIVERAKVKEAAVDTEGTCRYRVDGNGNNTSPENCCFVGVLVSPDNYDLKMEGHYPESVELQFPGTFPCERPEFLEWLESIQKIHDYMSMSSWIESLEAFKPKEEEGLEG